MPHFKILLLLLFFFSVHVTRLAAREHSAAASPSTTRDCWYTLACNWPLNTCFHNSKLCLDSCELDMQYQDTEPHSQAQHPHSPSQHRPYILTDTAGDLSAWIIWVSLTSVDIPRLLLCCCSVTSCHCLSASAWGIQCSCNHTHQMKYLHMHIL